MFDCHMHTNFSADSKMTIDEVVEASKNLSIGVILTEHMDIDFKGALDFTFDPIAYFEKYSPYRQDKLLLGIELGLQPHTAKKNKDILQKAPFDIVIGSTHSVKGEDLFYPEYYKGKTKEEAYALYFQEIIKNLEAFDDFDSLGHIDYISRYAPYEMPEIDYEVFKVLIDDILQMLIAKGKVLEVNTRRLGEKKARENYIAILKAYKALGGNHVTCGSDAHSPQGIGQGLLVAKAFLDELGLKAVYFKNRKMHIC